MSTADDSRHTRPSIYPYTLTSGNGGVVSTDGAEMQKAILTDVVHHETNLIHVAGQHNFHTPAWIDDTRDVAHHAGLDLIDERFDGGL